MDFCKGSAANFHDTVEVEVVSVRLCSSRVFPSDCFVFSQFNANPRLSRETASNVVQ